MRALVQAIKLFGFIITKKACEIKDGAKHDGY